MTGTDGGFTNTTHQDGEPADQAATVELFQADTIPSLGMFTFDLLEEDVGLEWNDASGKQALETMLIINQGSGGGVGLIISLLAHRDFKVGRVILALSPEVSASTTEVVETARAMVATDVVFFDRNEGGQNLKTQLDEIGVTKVTYTVVCYSSYKYTGPYVPGTSCELGASGESCEPLPALNQLDTFLRRSRSVWTSMMNGELIADTFGENDVQDRILGAMARTYPDDEHWPRLLGYASERLELKSVVLVQKSETEYTRMQIAVGLKDE